MLDGRETGTVLHIHGPGGVGKSSLLRQVGWHAESVGRRVERLDGRELDPGAAAATSADVLLIDEVDAIPGRRETVLEGLLGCLPAARRRGARGPGARRPPRGAPTRAGARSCTRSGWRTSATPKAAPCCGCAACRRRPTDGALAFTHGHPLALALLADVVAQSERDEPVAATPEVLKVLLDSLVGSAVPSALSHLAALERVARRSRSPPSRCLPRSSGCRTPARSSTGSASCPSWTSRLAGSTRTTSRARRWPASCTGDTPRRTTGCTAGRARSTSASSRAPTPPRPAGCSSTSPFLHRDSTVIGPFLRHVTPGRGDADGLSTGTATAAELPLLLATCGRARGRGVGGVRRPLGPGPSRTR